MASLLGRHSINGCGIGDETVSKVCSMRVRLVPKSSSQSPFVFREESASCSYHVVDV